ncbi:MAG: acetoin dehydrogenase [Woeseia sp.]|nr:acetoin dehydrogenase [Woeseia sp.]
MLKIPETFTGAVLTGIGTPLQIISGIKLPPLRYGQVLVKVAYAGVCHSQLMEARGHRGSDPWIPHLLGHEGTGTVIARGDGVTKVATGDKVVLTWIKGSGLEAGGCKFVGPDGATINGGAVTTFSNYTVVSENRLVPLPEGTPMELGVLYGCALPTGAGIVLNTAQPTSQSSVAVIGLGGIGLSALLAARSLGVTKLIAIDIVNDKLTLARDLGASQTINALEADPVMLCRKSTDGIGVDFAIEAAGSARSIEMAFEMTRRSGGRCIFASHPHHDERICLDPFELICGKRIDGSWGGSSNPDLDVEVLGKFYLAGTLPLERLVSTPYRLDRINDALDDLEKRRVTRALIMMDT